MTNRELLEAAAKAAGIALEWQADGWAHCLDTGCEWNPLTDDGDALRLAVKLRIAVDFDGIENGTAQAMQTDGARWEIEPYGTDPYAATRRAIVRAAAEIGRSKT